MNKEKEMQIDYFKSAIGLLRIGVIEGELVSLVFVNEKCESAEETPCSKLVKKQLKEYFKGKRLQFDVPMSVHGTPFQERVWAELQRIPFGETRSYQQIAEAVGDVYKRQIMYLTIHIHRILEERGESSENLSH